MVYAILDNDGSYFHYYLDEACARVVCSNMNQANVALGLPPEFHVEEVSPDEIVYEELIGFKFDYKPTPV